MSEGAARPTRKRLVLMRHGEVRYFGTDGRLVDPRSVALTEDGKAQATAAAALLAPYRFDRVAVSSAPRTQETAALVLGAGGGPLHILDDLREIRGGRFADVPVADIDRTIGRAFDGAALEGERFIGGEPFAAFEERVVGTFQGWLFDRPGDETLLAVLHEGVNRLLLSRALVGSRAAMAGLEQDPGCINIIDFDVTDGAVARAMVRMVNATPAEPSKAARTVTGMEELCAQYRRFLTL